jgi:hypothetical protein
MDPAQKWNEGFQLTVLLISHAHVTTSITFWVMQNFACPDTKSYFAFNFPTHSLYLLSGYHPTYASYGVTHAALFSMIHDSEVMVMLFSLGGGRGGKNLT